MSRTGKLLRLRLRCDPSAPRRAREAVAGISSLRPVRDAAVLIVSELATNAVVHSGCAPSEELEVVAERTAVGVRIAVTDPGHSGKEPTLVHGPLGVRGGMGLRVVAKLARRWGTETDDRVRVWAELAL
jgi:anti-sigma regulatory factor (Ser/Thr protein kinase)